MNNDPWTPEELADIEKTWKEFHELHPERSYNAWRLKRSDLRKGRAPTEKRKARWVQEEEEVTDEELWRAVVAYQEVSSKAFANKLHHEIEVPTSEPIAICFPSDMHIGSAGTDMRRMQEDFELIESHPRLYCALGGDPVDNFIFEKMASAARSQIAQVHVQWRLFRYRVLRLLESNSLLWVSSGNHDAWTHKAAGIDGVLSALGNIPVCYTGEGGFVHLTVGQQTYVIYRKHKPSRFSSGYNTLHFLKQMLRMGTAIEFDVGISEHLHEADLEVFEYRPGSKIDRVLIACGSYKVTDQYATDLGYYGGGYGVPTIVFYPDRRRMLPFMSIADALEALDGVSTSSPPLVKAA